MHIAGNGRHLTPIDPDEMNAVIRVARSGLEMHPEERFEAGQRVDIQHGPLAGLEGVLLFRRDRHRVVVYATILECGVSVEVNRVNLRTLDSPSDTLLKQTENP